MIYILLDQHQSQRFIAAWLRQVLPNSDAVISRQVRAFLAPRPISPPHTLLMALLEAVA